MNQDEFIANMVKIARKMLPLSEWDTHDAARCALDEAEVSMGEHSFWYIVESLGGIEAAKILISRKLCELSSPYTQSYNLGSIWRLKEALPVILPDYPNFWQQVILLAYKHHMKLYAIRTVSALTGASIPEAMAFCERLHRKFSPETTQMTDGGSK